MTQMIKVGEEAGEVGTYPEDSVRASIPAKSPLPSTALVSLIEPAMIVVMGAGVAILTGRRSGAYLQYCGGAIGKYRGRTSVSTLSTANPLIICP